MAKPYQKPVKGMGKASIKQIGRIMERLCIYPKEVTGKSERYGRSIIKQIKKKYLKDSHQLVTIEEFCKYIGLSGSDII